MDDLDPDVLPDLARFLTRRLPCPSEDGWDAHLARAQREGRLGAVLRAACRACPDPKLLEIRDLIAPRPAPPSRAWLVVAATATAGLVVAIGIALGLAITSGGEAEAAAPVAVVAPPPAPVPVVVAPAAVEEPAPSGTAAESEPLVEVAEVAAAPVAPPAPSVEHRSCKGSATGVVGWWYAGRQSPGSAGDLVELPRDTNVRIAAPGVDNRFDARTRVRCVLSRGDRVRLSEDPRLVAPGVYWVPLRYADIEPGS